MKDIAEGLRECGPVDVVAEYERLAEKLTECTIDYAIAEQESEYEAQCETRKNAARKALDALVLHLIQASASAAESRTAEPDVFAEALIELGSVSNLINSRMTNGEDVPQAVWMEWGLFAQACMMSGGMDTTTMAGRIASMRSVCAECLEGVPARTPDRASNDADALAVTTAAAEKHGVCIHCGAHWTFHASMLGDAHRCMPLSRGTHFEASRLPAEGRETEP